MSKEAFKRTIEEAQRAASALSWLESYWRNLEPSDESRYMAEWASSLYEKVAEMRECAKAAYRNEGLLQFEYRIILEPDVEPYECGDAEDAEECAQLVDLHGVWGFILERKRVGAPDTERNWEASDSCWGFIGGNDYIVDTALQSVPTGQTVKVYVRLDHGDLDPRSLVKEVTK